MTWVRVKRVVSRVIHSDAGWLELVAVFIVVVVLSCIRSCR